MIGRSGIDSTGPTPPSRDRHSATWRALNSSWASYPSCRSRQPPQRPKSGQGGNTRRSEGVKTRPSSPRANRGRTWVSRTSRRSPGTPPGTKTTNPPARATPSPPKARSVTSTAKRSPRFARAMMGHATPARHRRQTSVPSTSASLGAMPPPAPPGRTLDRAEPRARIMGQYPSSHHRMSSSKPAVFSPGYARYALAVLFLVNLFNYVDRQIMSGVLSLVQDDLVFSDAALGALASAFTILFLLG